MEIMDRNGRLKDWVGYVFCGVVVLILGFALIGFVLSVEELIIPTISGGIE